ncbi:P-loop containing nucleoside triphosphate hydrolase protein, partial [Mycena metata]
LPSKPKIFHGRESELSAILTLFKGLLPRIAVLGAGGIGKTSLARAVVHDPQIMSTFGPHRHFVLCESCTTEVELATLIGAHIGMKPGKDLTHPVLQHFSVGPPYLLVLDNLETVWEPLQSRRGTEEFLSLLTDIDDLAVLITMRGLERPGKVHGTHPFLHPLKPLEYTAARQTFFDIADDTHDPKELNKILALTDHMPLVINLLAHLVDSEGCFHVLTRWAEKKTLIISEGYDRTTNLDLSISLSLSSPRLNLLPQSKDLLSILSLLPDGLSDKELVQSGLPIDTILACKTALVGTSLAYSDEYKKLKALMPIREYMQRTRPPGDHLIRPLLFHFKEVLELHGEYRGLNLIPKQWAG